MEDLLDDSGVKGKGFKVNKGILVAFLVILPLGMWAALILAMWKIRTIEITGPVVLVEGALLFILAMMSKKVLTVILAGLSVFAVIFVALFILIYDISPSEAKGSVPFVILVFDIIVSLLATTAIRIGYFPGNADQNF